MRCRITIADGSTGVRSDVAVECAPDDRVADVLEPLMTSLQLCGAPTVDGAVLDLAAPASRVLGEGMLLCWGGTGPTAAAPPVDGLVLRTVSGPSAGTRVDLPVAGTVEVGRSSAAQLVLDDPDASRRHAAVTTGPDGVELRDLGSSNGVFVDGRALTGPHLLRDGEVVQIGGSRLVLESAQRWRAALEREAEGAVLVNRRFPDRRAPFAAPSVQLPSPPAEHEGRGLPLLAMLLPAVLSVVLAFALGNPIYLLFGLMTPLLVGGNWLTERRRRAGIGRRQAGSYDESLRAARAKVERAVADEDADLHARRPGPSTVVRIAVEPRVELWSRRPGEDGWLDIRLGTADRPASVTVIGTEPEGWTAPVLVRVPAGVDLDSVTVLGLAGPAEWLAARLDWMLVQCAVLHSPDELQIVVLAPHAEEGRLGWLRWLPHVRDAAGSVLAGWDDDGVDALLKHLVAELDRRAVLAAGRQAMPVGQILVVLTGAGALGRRPAVVDLLTRGPRLGLRAVCTDVDDRLLPDTCRAVLVGDERRSELRVDRGELTTVHPDTLSIGATEAVARRLAPMRRVGDRPAGGLPDAVRFTDDQPVPDAEEIRALWRLAPERTEVVIGRDAEGPAVLDIERDGPHALVAGTSGAGKSELLQTWTAALALANTPERLSMVFIDYKGGAAFKDLVGLPHVVGSVTNLDERLAARALASLGDELRRRQEQLKAAGARDRGDYLHRRVTRPDLAPYPRLLIVVDELAELKERLPGMVDGLVNVARTGRSMGVHLVLATQKPAGVVDGQIRANVGLRICLRTATPGESMDVIETPAAADIPHDRPGRAIVLRGSPPARVVQTARVTTPRGATDAVVRRAEPLHWDDAGAPARPVAPSDGTSTDLDALVEALVEAARAEGLAAPFRPWADPLPAVVGLDAFPVAPLRIPVGLRDARRRHEPLQLPLGTGNLAVVGSGRTGRTSALRAIAAGLARDTAPDAVHLHVIDGSGGLAGLAALPHAGVVVTPDDPERLERLLTRLLDTVAERRRAMAAHGASTVAELPGAAVPHVVLLVDSWSGVSEPTEMGPPAMLHALLDGSSAAAGVTICLAGDERLTKARVLGRIEHRLCLRLNTPSDAVVLGLDSRNLPDGLPPGRGLWAADGSEVQVPLLAPDPTGPAQTAALAALADELRGRWPVEPDPAAAPLRLDPLPSRIAWGVAARLGPAPARSLLLGVGGDRLAPLHLELDGLVGHVVVAGPGRSGRSTVLAALAASAQGSGASAALVAARPGPAHRAAGELGVTVLAPADLTGDLGAFALVAIDDIDVLAWDDAVVAHLVAPGSPRLAVAAGLDSFGFGARGLVKEVRRAIGAVVLLSPPTAQAATNVDVKIARAGGFTGPPGRAYLVVDGEPVLGQVPDVSAG